MDGVHDLGGKHGFGPIDYDTKLPPLHEKWQETAFALMIATVALMRNHTADAYRHSVERMRPSHYFAATYYERVLTGVATLLVERGVVTHAELEARAGGTFPLALPVADNPMADLPPQPKQRFIIGQQVRVLDFHPRGHTRAPGFCRGRRGTVLHVAPPFPFPDASAHDGLQRKEHTYHVEFTAQELWGSDGGTNESVVVDLWDCYLEGVE